MNTTLITITYNCYDQPITLLSYYQDNRFHNLTYRKATWQAHPTLFYCDTPWSNSSQAFRDKLDKIANYVPVMLDKVKDVIDPKYIDHTFTAYITKEEEEDIVIRLVPRNLAVLVNTIKAEAE